MRNAMSRLALVLLVALFAGCDSDKPSESVPTSNVITPTVITPTVITPTVITPTVITTATLTASVSTAKTGIRECDDYFVAVSRCIEKASDDKRKALAAGANMMRANLNGSESDKQFYASGCKNALDAIAADEECR